MIIWLISDPSLTRDVHFLHSGISIRFVPETTPEERLCPSEESGYGTSEYHPEDGCNGEKFFDPFAFDVACLGGVFCELIGLAPLLDRMIAPDISARYTAREALDALVKVLSELDNETLIMRVTAPPVGPQKYPRIP
ncbi:hypothetical protein QCA50_012446 [Cerrena zonata]|uniref:Protein kinase domain-containing protein n=1 Tax=Cerrena zonata TaxID=2478898 RepID=A0AAW0FZI1_9APHY